MEPRIKKLIGLAILLPALFIYIFIAAAIGERVPDFWLLKLVYYIIAGVVWAFPMKPLMMWMNAPKASSSAPPSNSE